MTVVSHRPESVTFFEDRARVERLARVELSAGVHKLRFEGLAPAAVDSSVVVRSETLRIDDSTFDRQWIIGASEHPGEVALITQEYEKLRDEAERLLVEQNLLESDKTRLHLILQNTLEALSLELPYATTFPPAAKRSVEDAWKSLRTMRDAEHQVTGARVDLVQRYDALLARAKSLNVEQARMTNTLEVAVRAEQAGSHAVQVLYTVPCALWRPMHRASIKGGNVHFECAAALWQASGEEWTDVEVRCSTARSTQRAEPPVLQDDWLSTRERVTKQVIATVREQTLSTTGAGVAQDDVPGVDDGGEVRLLTAKSRATLRPDGRLHRVPLFSFTTPAALSRVCRPEIATEVFVRAHFANTSNAPLLAGPVELVRDGTNVGLSKIGFVAPSEKTVLSFGSEDSLRVRREARENRETAKLTGKQSIHREVELFVSHTGDETLTFAIEERVPVSELKEVEIRVDTRPLPDADGIVRYEVEVGPERTLDLHLKYTVIASSDIRGL
jgi:uncharacterized protein (TIGR02231 family)